MAEFVDWQQRRVDEELRELRRLLSEMVPRPEHTLKWKADDLRFEKLEKGQVDIQADIKAGAINTNRLIGALGVLGPIIAVILAHFLH